ncbi:MAG TPA: hypothetical protein VIT43_13075 [Candidatus Dormibacteraeota bacterium]
MSRKAEGVEAVLRKADAALDDWFRQSKITTRQASKAFARFLERSKRQGAGALRHQVEGLQAGLEKLSTELHELERAPRRATPKRRRAASPRSASTTRKTRKAA